MSIHFEVDHDIILVRKWFCELSILQQDYLSSQIMFILPFCQYTLDQCTPEAFIRLFEDNHKIDTIFDNTRSMLFLMCIYHALNIFISDYPSTDDEYLDWYNLRRGIYKLTGPRFTTYGYKGDINDVDSVMAFHSQTMLQAKSSWESAKKQMTLMKL